jgi:hypothetical protein
MRHASSNGTVRRLGRSVDSGDKTTARLPILSFDDQMLMTVGIDQLWSPDMLVRPSELARRMSGEQRPQTFTLPLDAARCKAREIIDQSPRSGFTPTIENWRQLLDGQIEFAIRHFPAAD